MTARALSPVRCIAGLLVGLAASGGAQALTDEETLLELRFEPLAPGARASSLGGASIAEAGDVAATCSNPAALQLLERLEIQVDYRLLQSTPASARTGAESGEVSGVPTLDTARGAAAEDRSLPAFLGLAWPLRFGTTRATLSLSRRVVLDTEYELREEANDLRLGLASFPLVVAPGPPPRIEPYTIGNVRRGGLAAELTYYDVGFSIALSESISVGTTATLARLDVTSDLRSTTTDPLGILDPVNPRSDRDGDGGLDPIVRFSSIDDGDSAFGWSFGLHWHPLAPDGGPAPVRFGLAYHRGADLAVVERTGDVHAGSGESFAVELFDNRWRLPDRYGVGASWSPNRRWTLALDVERIEYSDLLAGFRSGMGFLTGPLVQANGSDLQLDPQRSFEFGVDDATLVRLGAEYRVERAGRLGYALRGGYFESPDSAIRMTRFNSADAATNELFEDLFRGGKDEGHVTAGASLFWRSTFELQLAVDLSDRVDQYGISAIRRFGRAAR